MKNNFELNDILKRIRTELEDTDMDKIFSSKIELTVSGKIMYVYSEF